MFDRKTGFESLNCENPYTITGPETGMAGGAAAPQIFATLYFS